MRFKKLLCGITVALILTSLSGTVFAGENLEKYQEMYRLRSEEQYLECINFANSILEENPYFMGAYTNKALAAYQYGDYSAAYETFDKQLSLNPYNRVALYNKACLAAVITDYATVERSVRLLLDMDISVKSLIEQDSDFVNCEQNEYMVTMLFNPFIRVCGTVLDSSVPPVNENGRLLIPIRPVIEAMGATIEWNSDDKSFAVIMDDKNLIMQINSETAKINGETLTVETAPVLINERTYVPVRFVAETMGFEVEWNPDLKLADIYTKVPNGNLPLASFKEYINGNLDTSVISGMYIEPYILAADEGIVMLIMNDLSVLDEFQKLSTSDKSEFLKTSAAEAFNEIEGGCNKATVRLVFGNNTYYMMEYDYTTSESGKLTYFKNGLLTNVVKQFPAVDNYLDYYYWKSLGSQN